MFASTVAWRNNKKAIKSKNKESRKENHQEGHTIIPCFATQTTQQGQEQEATDPICNVLRLVDKTKQSNK